MKLQLKRTICLHKLYTKLISRLTEVVIRLIGYTPDYKTRKRDCGKQRRGRRVRARRRFKEGKRQNDGGKKNEANEEGREGELNLKNIAKK